MPNYRRNRIPGGTYFFTVNLRDRRSGLLVAQIEALREAVRAVRRQSPFDIDAWVVLPDHMHCLWTLPESDSEFPDRWRRIKAAFSKSLPDTKQALRPRLRKGELGIWQRGYWEHTVRDDRDYAAHMDYIHFNPVKHGRSPKTRAIGLSPAFAGAYQPGSIPPVGSAAARNMWKPASADECGVVTGGKINVFGAP
jgi:putative transposase